jgi:hypothetical protein
MLKKIILYIQRLFLISYHKPPPLGRWNIESCHKKLNNKIDLANEDNCGPCGKYLKNAIKKIEKIEK